MALPTTLKCKKQVMRGFLLGRWSANFTPLPI